MDFEKVYGDYPWKTMEKELNILYPDWNISFSQLMEMVISGQGMEAVEGAIKSISFNLMLEWGSWKHIFFTTMVVILLSAMFLTFKDAFQNHQIADISFYINYLILIILFTGLFQQALELGDSTLGSIEEFMRLFFPAYFMAVGIAAGATTGVVYYQLACLVIYGIELLLKNLLIPAISGYMLFCMMNGIWGEERLELFLELWKKGIKLVQRLILGTLTGASLIQSMITPVIERIKGETIYQAVEAVPGVGELTEGALRLWMGSTVLIKNGVGIVGCLILLGVTLAPLLKLGFMGGMLKLVAALLGMVGEKRMIQFTNRVGDGILLLGQTVAYGILLFLVLIAITAHTTNGGF